MQPQRTPLGAAYVHQGGQVHQSLFPLPTEHVTRFHPAFSFALGETHGGILAGGRSRPGQCKPPTDDPLLLKTKDSMALAHGKTQGSSSLKP